VTSFQSGRSRYVGVGDLYRFDGVGRVGDLHFSIDRALVERIAGRAANPHAPEDLFDEVEPILFRIAERAYRLRGAGHDGRITLTANDLD
jgi:histone H3/H4